MNKLEPKKVKHKFFDVDTGKCSFEYILFEDIPAEYHDEFGKWMCGQSCPIVEVDGKEQMAVYWYDWIRWYHYKTGKTFYLAFD